MQVPLLDLKAQYAKIKDEILAAVSQVLQSQVCIGGPKVAELEQKIAAISDCKFAVGVSSGTDAILSSLMSLDISPDDEVVTTPFTFFATAGCIARTGAKPVFVDIDPRTYNINPSLIEAAVTERTRAIMPVHLFGQMADMDLIMAIANKYNLVVIEDAAQSITSTYKGRKAGSIGTVGCFSFFPSKNLGGAGDGGMVVTNDAQLAQKIELLRKLGAQPKYFHKVIGYNSRLDTLQAAILEVKLKYLDEWSKKRREHAKIYNEAFKGLDIITPKEESFNYHIYNQYTIAVKNRNELEEYLKKNEIGHDVYYPLPMHLQECYKDLGYKMGDLPISERCSKRVVSLPIFPELVKEEQDFVIEKLREFVGE